MIETECDAFNDRYKAAVLYSLRTRQFCVRPGPTTLLRQMHMAVCVINEWGTREGCSSASRSSCFGRALVLLPTIRSDSRIDLEFDDCSSKKSCVIRYMAPGRS